LSSVLVRIAVRIRFTRIPSAAAPPKRAAARIPIPPPQTRPRMALDRPTRPRTACARWSLAPSPSRQAPDRGTSSPADRVCVFAYSGSRSCGPRRRAEQSNRQRRRRRAAAYGRKHSFATTTIELGPGLRNVAKAIARRKPARRTKQSRRRRPGSGPAVVSGEPWATQRGRGSQSCCACGRPAHYPGWTSRRGLSVAKWSVARPRRCLIGCPVCRLRGKLRLTSFVGFSYTFGDPSGVEYLCRSRTRFGKLWM
jgi:hypothetical protein